jgi:hypothetical protein
MRIITPLRVGEDNAVQRAEGSLVGIRTPHGNPYRESKEWPIWAWLVR